MNKQELQAAIKSCHFVMVSIALNCSKDDHKLQITRKAATEIASALDAGEECNAVLNADNILIIG